MRHCCTLVPQSLRFCSLVLLLFLSDLCKGAGRPLQWPLKFFNLLVFVDAIRSLHEALLYTFALQVPFRVCNHHTILCYKCLWSLCNLVLLAFVRCKMATSGTTSCIVRFFCATSAFCYGATLLALLLFGNVLIGSSC